MVVVVVVDVELVADVVAIVVLLFRKVYESGAYSGFSTEGGRYKIYTSERVNHHAKRVSVLTRSRGGHKGGILP